MPDNSNQRTAYCYKSEEVDAQGNDEAAYRFVPINEKYIQQYNRFKPRNTSVNTIECGGNLQHWSLTDATEGTIFHFTPLNHSDRQDTADTSTL
jgi:hypothetical protein